MPGDYAPGEPQTHFGFQTVSEKEKGDKGDI